MSKIEDQDPCRDNDTLNEYAERGSYHTDLNLARNWIPLYLRRFHVANRVISQFYSQTATIADIGGGEGVFVHKLAQQGFCNAIGIDPYAPFMHEQMQKGSIFDLPLEDASIDVITCLDVLEHIPLHKQVIAAKELFRVQRAGGITIVSVPNMAHLRSRFSFMFRGKPWRNKLQKHPGELTMRERVEVLCKVGFKLADSVGLHLPLSYDPRPGGLSGKILSKIMFSPHMPTSFCRIVVLMFYKPPRPKWMSERSGFLKKALSSYVPSQEDPTRD